MWDMFSSSLELAERPLGVVNVHGINLGVERPSEPHRIRRYVIGRIQLTKEYSFERNATEPPESGTRYRYVAKELPEQWRRTAANGQR